MLMRITPITGTIGAELSGLDLKQPISEDLEQALRAALDNHLVLVIQDQFLDAAQHRLLSEVFGKPMANPYAPGKAPHPEMTHVIKEADDAAGVFGGGEAVADGAAADGDERPGDSGGEAEPAGSAPPSYSAIRLLLPLVSALQYAPLIVPTEPEAAKRQTRQLGLLPPDRVAAAEKLLGNGFARAPR